MSTLGMDTEAGLAASGELDAGSQKIAELYPEIMSCSVQPGAVATDIGGDDQGFFVNLLKRLGTGGKYLTPEEGAYNMCWVATTERENLENGAYYEPIGQLVVPTTIHGRNPTLARKLYEWTEKELAAFE